MASKTTKLPPAVYQLIHFSLVLITTLVLAYFSTSMIPESQVESSSAFVRRYYLGFLFVLFYIFVRMILYLIELFRFQEIPEFKDIDQAWKMGIDALARQGYHLQELPVFLVLGLTEDNDRSFFSATRMQWKVASPGKEDVHAPLQFYANDSAIFISAPDVGATCRQVSNMKEEIPLDDSQPIQANAPQMIDTLLQEDIQQVLTEQQPSAPMSASHTLMPGQTGSLLSSFQDNPSEKATSVAKIAKLSPQELDLCRRRLEYLCRLITEERGQFCQINGLLMVNPLEWSVSQKMQEMFQSTRQDVQTIHEQFQLEFPTTCLFSGLEGFDGYQEFLDRGCKLDARFKDSRAGARFPMSHEVDDQSSHWLVEKDSNGFEAGFTQSLPKNLATRLIPFYTDCCVISMIGDNV